MRRTNAPSRAFLLCVWSVWGDGGLRSIGEAVLTLTAKGVAGCRLCQRVITRCEEEEDTAGDRAEHGDLDWALQAPLLSSYPVHGNVLGVCQGEDDEQRPEDHGGAEGEGADEATEAAASEQATTERECERADVDLEVANDERQHRAIEFECAHRDHHEGDQLNGPGEVVRAAPPLESMRSCRGS